MTTSTPTLNGQVLGEAEHATAALLQRVLGNAGITFHQWVILNGAKAGGGSIARAAVVARMTGALKIDESTAQAGVEAVLADGLATQDGASLTLTTSGQERHALVAGAVAVITQRLYGDLPAEDLATAGRVLTLVTARANAELAAA
jgi:hypothetical protein